MFSNVMPTTPASHKNILAISVDYDGCYCYLQYGVIVDHTQFHQFLFDLIRQGNYEEIALLVGSLRQSRDIDVYAHTNRGQNGSITQSLTHLLESLKQELKIPVNIIPWLLEDVVMGLSQPEQFEKHKAFVTSKIPNGSVTPTLPRHLSAISAGDKEASKQFSVDDGKITILLFQTHLLDQLFPKAKIRLMFVDDIAQDIYHSFTQIGSCETYLTDNLQLQLIVYDTSCTPRFIGKAICGTSKNNFLDPIKKNVAEQVNEHKEKNVPLLNADKIIDCIRAAKQSLHTTSSSTQSISTALNQMPANTNFATTQEEKGSTNETVIAAQAILHIAKTSAISFAEGFLSKARVLTQPAFGKATPTEPTSNMQKTL